jgi:hypothetical protein
VNSIPKPTSQPAARKPVIGQVPSTPRHQHQQYNAGLGQGAGGTRQTVGKEYKGAARRWVCSSV